LNKPAKITLLFLVVSFVFVLAVAAYQKAEETVKCPVSGKEIKKSEAKATYEYEGKTYYFCCENCKDAFMKDPEKYAHQEGGKSGAMHAHHEAEAEVVDPVCGMKINRDEAKATHEYEGKTYFFCTEGCKEKFVKNPGKYVQDVEEMVTCPVSGEKIAKSKAAASMEYEGKTYYFCCAGCKTKFVENPEKYVKRE